MLLSGEPWSAPGMLSEHVPYGPTTRSRLGTCQPRPQNGGPFRAVLWVHGTYSSSIMHNQLHTAHVALVSSNPGTHPECDPHDLMHGAPCYASPCRRGASRPPSAVNGLGQ